MQTVSTIGLDIAKSLFQVHGVDGAGQVAALCTDLFSEAAALPGRH